VYRFWILGVLYYKLTKRPSQVNLVVRANGAGVHLSLYVAEIDPLPYLSMELRLMDIMVGVRSAALQWREPGGLQVPTVATNQ